MADIPFVGFSNETLNRQPKVRKGDVVECPHCGGEHVLYGCTGSLTLLFYDCAGNAYLAAINGRLTIGTPADMSGHL